MSADKKYKTVNIPNTIIEKILKSKNQTVTLNNLHSWINSSIENTVSKDQYLELITPHLTLAANTADGIIIRDTSMPKNQLAEVVFKSKKIYCETCTSESCAHIDFVRTIQDFGKMIRESLKLT